MFLPIKTLALTGINSNTVVVLLILLSELILSRATNSQLVNLPNWKGKPRWQSKIQANEK